MTSENIKTLALSSQKNYRNQFKTPLTINLNTWIPATSD